MPLTSGIAPDEPFLRSLRMRRRKTVRFCITALMQPESPLSKISFSTTKKVRYLPKVLPSILNVNTSSGGAFSATALRIRHASANRSPNETFTPVAPFRLTCSAYRLSHKPWEILIVALFALFSYTFAIPLYTCSLFLLTPVHFLRTIGYRSPIMTPMVKKENHLIHRNTMGVGAFKDRDFPLSQFARCGMSIAEIDQQPQVYSPQVAGNKGNAWTRVYTRAAQDELRYRVLQGQTVRQLRRAFGFPDADAVLAAVVGVLGRESWRTSSR